MKKDIHPEYFPNAKISCACGWGAEVGSTLPAIQVEICSHCHPLFTGKQKIVDTAGRIEKYTSRLKRKDELAKTIKPKKRVIKTARRKKEE